MKQQSHNEIYKIIIIGGGAAGLYAGALKSTGGGRGLILERKEQPGKKLLITGSGQCNLTHSGSVKDFPKHYHEGEKKIRSILYGHSNRQVTDFFQACGLPVVTREDGKIFPASLRAVEVRDLLVSRCKANGYRILTDSPCTSLAPLNPTAGQLSDSKFSGDNGSPDKSFSSNSFGKARWKVSSQNRHYLAEHVLVTAGGASVPQTGSDGSFLKILESLKIETVPLKPALTPIFVQQYPFSELSGISFPDASVTIRKRNGEKKISRRGALLLTHESFSGPGILDNSRYAETGNLLCLSYLKDSTHADELADRLTQNAANTKSKILPLVLQTLSEGNDPLPRRFLEIQIRRAGTDPSRNATETGRKTWRKIAGMLTEDTYSISGTGGFAGAMATRGGVSLSGVNPKTMESRRFPGLYFAGEILDVDGDTGGYNLQFAFSSAAQAVKSIFPAEE